jgi:hypothetical protein
LKYYWKLLPILTALCVSIALADDFKTIDGKEYKDAVVSRVEPDGIVLRTNGGISKVYFAELPKEVQERFHYVDPAKLDAEKAAKAAKTAAEERAAAEAEKAQAEERARKRAQDVAERFVLSQATAGEIANLEKEFHEEKDRKLSAHFLEELLAGTLPGFKPHRNGVRIIGAMVDEPIDLTNAQIPYEVLLQHCQFSGSVNFRQASFAASATFSTSTFNGSAEFGRIKVGDSAIFYKTVFEGPVVFAGASITGELVAEGAQFNNKERLMFTVMKVGGRADFNKAVFEGPVNFYMTTIASNFEANEAQFENKEQGAHFVSMKVGGDAVFDGACFEGPADFIGTDISVNFAVKKARFRGRTNFQSMKVGGLGVFDDANFERTMDVRFADFGSLSLLNVLFPKVVDGLSQLHYKYISAGSGADSHEALFELARSLPYNGSWYSKLEDFLLREGYRTEADKAFIEGKRREREQWKPKPKGSGWQYLCDGRWFLWLGSLILDLLVGYGRRPWQAAIPCAVLIALGCVLFSPNKMEPRNPKEAPRVYNRFWYSLGLFLPFVDLQADKVWKPKKDQAFLRNYLRVHALLGWILIPLVLAALTGLIN